MNGCRNLLVAMALLVLLSGCASTLQETGKDFRYTPEKIVIDKTKKGEILASYGQPTKQETLGKYTIYIYQYEKLSMSHAPAMGMLALDAVTLGVSSLVADQGVKDSDIKKEFQVMKIYFGVGDGIVRDFYYRNSQGQGHDRSETLYIEANAKRKAGQNEEAIKTLRRAVAENPRNHRALNLLAWQLIDLDISPTEGVELAKRAVEIFPDSPHNNGTLGVGYFKINDLKLAKKYLETAIALFPVYAPNDKTALANDQGILKLVNDRLNQ